MFFSLVYVWTMSNQRTFIVVLSSFGFNSFIPIVKIIFMFSIYDVGNQNQQTQHLVEHWLFALNTESEAWHRPPPPHSPWIPVPSCVCVGGGKLPFFQPWSRSTPGKKSHSVLWCGVLCCAVMCCVVLCSVVLCCVMLWCCVVVCYSMLYYLIVCLLQF